MEKPGGLRKRQQITRANQIMFLWIAVVSAVVGFSIVLMVFLAQRIWFGEKVIAEKQHTISVLEKNLKVVSDLKDNVRLLNTNEDLRKVRLNDSDSALQVVLDALPADANSTAMASSLQMKLLTGVPGVIVESLKVDPVSGLEVDSDDSSSGSSDPSEGAIGFSFVVSASAGQQDGLRKVLQRIESSIRPFTITNLSVESQGSRITMSATGLGYYELARQVELTDKVVQP